VSAAIGGWPGDAPVRQFLRSVRRVAVVGLSADPGRPSHEVAAYLLGQGYDVVPVRPDGDRILGRTVQRSLAEVPGADLVDVFRRADAAAEVVRQGVAAGIRAFWLQEGVVSDEAAREALRAGALFVQDRCLMKEHRRLGVGPVPRPEAPRER
jgi:predicted CoA-binding protein